MKPFTDQGADLLHLDLAYDKTSNNYFIKTTRIVEGFNAATDAVMIKNQVFVIEYGVSGGNIWKISLPK